MLSSDEWRPEAVTRVFTPVGTTIHIYRPVLIVNNAYQQRYVLYNRRPKITTLTVGYELLFHWKEHGYL